MKWCAATECDHGETGEILAVLDRVDPSGIGHVLVDNLGDADGSGHGIHAQLVTDLCGDCCGSLFGRESNVLGPEVVGVKSAQLQVGVGHGWVLAAAVICRWAGFRAGTVGADTDLAK